MIRSHQKRPMGHLRQRLSLSLIAVVAFIGACDDEPDVEEALPEQEPRQVEQARLAEGFEDVHCVGEEDQADLERALYGEVLGPDRRRADAAVGPLADIEVSLVLVDKRGRSEEGLVDESATTDDRGRWCLIAPENIELSPVTVLFADTHEETLRAPVLRPGRIDVDAPTEALLRILVEEGILLTQIHPATFEALDDQSRQALERASQVRPRAGGGLTSYLARIHETLRDDEEFMLAVEAAYLETMAE